MQPSSLLVIDDDSTLLYSIQKSLSSKNLHVITASSASAGLDSIVRHRPMAILLDLRLHEASGLDVLKEIRKHDQDVPVIIFTAFSTTATTIEATKSGAFDYLLKPVDLQKLKATVNRALTSRQIYAEQPQGDAESQFVFSSEIQMIGSSAAMQEVYKQIGRFAPSDGSVLIGGESGTGKELVAQAIHRYSKRRSGPFLAINCAALSETLLESELFGHERGAFTGADKRRIGKFEYANGGTIFLDEVADMSHTTQAKVLRLLQDQRFERLGGNEVIKGDVRVVAATNKNLGTLVQQGKFRDDLYYRLNVFSIHLPPLRDRQGDLRELVNYFIRAFKNEFGKDRVQVDNAVLEVLSQYRWPGNMRELQSVVRYALAYATGSVIHINHLPPHLTPSHVVTETRPCQLESEEAGTFIRMAQLLLAKGDPDIYEKLVSHLEAIILPLVLSHTNGNLQNACHLLGLSRNTLKAKMRQHQISLTHAVLSKNDRLSLNS